MTINLDAYNAHINITLNLSQRVELSATFLETICFHLIDPALTKSTSSNVFNIANQEIIFRENIVEEGEELEELSEDTLLKIQAIAEYFLDNSGQSAMFLITPANMQVMAEDRNLVRGQALTIASGDNIEELATVFTQNVLIFPVYDKKYVNTLQYAYVFYLFEDIGIDGDYLKILTMIFSKTGDEFFNRKILFSQIYMSNPANCIVYEIDILNLHKNKLSSVELVNSPNLGRISNFATQKDNGMGLYKRFKIKYECEKVLNELIAREDFVYNALTISDGNNGVIGRYQNCLIFIKNTLQVILNAYAEQGYIMNNFIVYVPSQSKENFDKELIGGIVCGYNPYKTPFRLEVTMTDTVSIDENTNFEVVPSLPTRTQARKITISFPKKEVLNVTK